MYGPGCGGARRSPRHPGDHVQRVVSAGAVQGHHESRAGLSRASSGHGGQLDGGIIADGASVSRLTRRRCVARSSSCSGIEAPTGPTTAASFAKMPTTSERRSIPPLRRSRGLSGVQLGPVRGRGAHVGQHVRLGAVHQGRELGHPGAELVGHRPPPFTAAGRKRHRFGRMPCRSGRRRSGAGSRRRGPWRRARSGPGTAAPWPPARGRRRP